MVSNDGLYIYRRLKKLLVLSRDKSFYPRKNLKRLNIKLKNLSV